MAKVTKPILDRPPMTCADWKTANHYDNLQKGDEKAQKAYREAVEEGKPTGEVFRKAVSQTSKEFYLGLVEDLDAAIAELQRLSELIEERYQEAEDVPRLIELRGALDEFNYMISDIEKTTGPLRKVEEEETGEEGAGEGEGRAKVKFTGEGIPMDPVDRADALRRLQSVANYFRTAEPHSPITFLVERAIAWAGMGLDQWLMEVVKDEAVLSHIRETLGVKAPESY
jgi:type VI secretion system protein ImpA